MAYTGLGALEEELPELLAPEDILVRLNEAPWDPAVLARRFVTATGPTLMAMYALGFRRFVQRWRSAEAIGLVREAAIATKAEVDVDHHRLDAMAAVVACHLLPITLDEEKEAICEAIGGGLADSRREVREIVLQNLICATAPHYDSMRHMAINSRVVSQIGRVIGEAEECDKLLSPASFAVEFFLNMRCLARERGDHAVMRAVEDQLHQVTGSKAGHFCYLSHLIKLHAETFPRARAFDSRSLPPQSSELLIGCLAGPGRWPRYVATLALIRARVLFSVWQTAIGRDVSHERVMTQSDARRALPKILALLEGYEVWKVLPESSTLNLPRPEFEFRRFLEADVKEVRTDSQVRRFLPSTAERQLAARVPFSQHGYESCIPRQASRGGLLLKLLTSGIECLKDMDVVLAAHQLVTVFRPEAAREHIESRAQEVVEAARRHEQEVDGQIGEAMDRNEAKLGSARFPGPGADELNEGG